MSSFSHPHNYYNNPPSVGWKVTLTDLVSISFAFVFVLARLFTKFFLVKAPGWDDCTASEVYPIDSSRAKPLP